MSPWEYAMMRMSTWEYAMAWISSCRYAMNANAPLWVYHDTECFGANTIYSNIPFIFKTRLPQRLKPKYFQTQFIIPKKSSSFWLKAPKKLVITIRKSLNGALTWNLMIWLKRFIFTIWLSKKGQCSSKALFLKKMNSLKIKHLKKIHFCCSWIWQFDKRQDPPW